MEEAMHVGVGGIWKKSLPSQIGCEPEPALKNKMPKKRKKHKPLVKNLHKVVFAPLLFQ